MMKQEDLKELADFQFKNPILIRKEHFHHSQYLMAFLQRLNTDEESSVISQSIRFSLQALDRSEREKCALDVFREFLSQKNHMADFLNLNDSLINQLQGFIESPIQKVTLCQLLLDFLNRKGFEKSLESPSADFSILQGKILNRTTQIIREMFLGESTVNLQLDLESIMNIINSIPIIQNHNPLLLSDTELKKVADIFSQLNPKITESIHGTWLEKYLVPSERETKIQVHIRNSLLSKRKARIFSQNHHDPDADQSPRKKA